MTNDLQRRFAEHEYGALKGCYTLPRRSVDLVYSQEFSTPIEAIAAEKQIKGWSRKKKAALIKGDMQELVRLSNNICPPSTSSG